VIRREYHTESVDCLGNRRDVLGFGGRAGALVVEQIESIRSETHHTFFGAKAAHCAKGQASQGGAPVEISVMVCRPQVANAVDAQSA